MLLSRPFQRRVTARYTSHTRQYVVTLCNMRKMLRTTLTAIIAATAIATTAAPTVHAAPSIPTASPGAKIVNDINVSCTIGFVDTTRRIAYTAAHCVGPNGRIYDEANRYLGTVPTRLILQEDPGKRIKDSASLAPIILTDNAIASDTLPTGERLTGVDHTVTLGTAVCKTGATTGHTCGTVMDLYPATYLSTATADHGDSGGPLYTTDGTHARLAGILVRIISDTDTRSLSYPASLIAAYLSVKGLTWQN